jgi:hypothetical protein
MQNNFQQNISFVFDLSSMKLGGAEPDIVGNGLNGYRYQNRFQKYEIWPIPEVYEGTP